MVAADGEQALVGDDDERVDGVGEAANPLFCLTKTSAPLELERFGDHAHGEGALLACDVGDDGGCARAGATTHARRHEDHVGAFETLGDPCLVLERGASADLGVGASAKSLGQASAELDLGTSQVVLERLNIGIRCHEVDVANPLRDHRVDRVAAASTHAEHFDSCCLWKLGLIKYEHDVFFLLYERAQITEVILTLRGRAFLKSSFDFQRTLLWSKPPSRPLPWFHDGALEATISDIFITSSLA